MKISAVLDPGNWSRADGGPLYLQLSEKLSEAVSQGLLAPGSPLPPEREIAAMTGLSRVTVRKAIGRLVEDGLVIQKQGSGSFVAPPAPRLEQSLSRLTSFTEDMADRNTLDVVTSVALAIEAVVKRVSSVSRWSRWPSAPYRR